MQLTVAIESAPTPSSAGPCWGEPPVAQPRRRCHDDRGEGVISAAIAVLVMAFLGVGMWIAFHGTLNKATNTVDTKVNQCIGNSGSNC